MIAPSYLSVLRFALAALLLGACARPTPKLFEVAVSVTSDGVAPVAGALIRVGETARGATNALGRATLHVPGNPGDALPVALTCPDGYRTPSGGTTLTLPAVISAAPEGSLPLSLGCELELRDAVVVVHALGSDTLLPVKVDGVVVGQTDALGFAHVHVRAAPNAEFEVSLDTSGNQRLTPANPTQRFRVEQRDELFVLDTAFEEPRTPARKGRRSKRRARLSPSPSP